VRSYVHTFGLPAVITRCSNNYGPYQFPEKLIPLFISNLARDEPVPVYGDGQQVRDWIHVRDHAAAVHRAWRDGRPGEVYNFGGRCERTNLALTHALLDVLDKRLGESEYVAGPEYTIADMANWPWYGGLVKFNSYGGGEFIEAQSYKNVIRWTEQIWARPAVKRGRMVNRTAGEPAGQLHERHDSSDFETKTQDKLAAAD